MTRTARTDDVLPPPSRLDAAVRTLAAEGRHRELIGYIERWASYAEPPASARLAQAQAFVGLCQPDRAWIRLRSLAEAPEASTDVLRTAADLFLLRGWPDRAREVLTRALSDAPDDAALQRLWDLASQPAVEPPDPASVQGASPDTALKVAEQHLSRGNTTIAKRLLNQVSAQPNPPHRVRDLLWTLDGMQDPEPATLKDLTERYAPSNLNLGGWTEEHTDSITQEGARPLLDTDEASASDSFPALFRGLDDSLEPQDEVTEEVTHTQNLMAMAALATARAAEAPDPAGFEPDSGDTKVIRVRDRDGVPEFDVETEPSAHKAMDQSVHSPSLALEDEDDDLVVFTSRGAGSSDPSTLAEADPTMTQIGREVAHLLGGKPPKKPTPPTTEPDPSVLTALPDDAPLSEAEPDVPQDPEPPSSHSAVPFITVTAILVIGAGILILGGLSLVMMLLW
ncbi:MAG: tetratricopeptide repeat protein [Myxococcota bacterium]